MGMALVRCGQTRHRDETGDYQGGGETTLEKHDVSSGIEQRAGKVITRVRSVGDDPPASGICIASTLAGIPDFPA